MFVPLKGSFVKIPTSLLLCALVILPGCVTTRLPNLSKPLAEVPTCPVEAFQACRAPVLSKDDSLGATEAADVENRARWLACIERHNAWLGCAASLIDRGFLKAPK